MFPPMTTLAPRDARSGYDQRNLGALLAAGGSARNVTQAGQAQYSTPPAWARFFARLLPGAPASVFDPQCAGGHLLRDFPWDTLRLGIELDRRFEDSREAGPGLPLHRLTANCVDVWRLLDELFPEVRFPCQVANPPFGLKWKVGAAGDLRDSVAHTWQKVHERAAPGGFGYFIAGRSSIESLQLSEFPSVYLVQWFPAGLFPGVSIEIGVLHWHKSAQRYRPSSTEARLVLPYVTLDEHEHGFMLAQVREFYRKQTAQLPTPNSHLPSADLWLQLAALLAEERRGIPEFNVFLAKDGALRLHLGTRVQLERRLAPDEVERLAKVDGCHPLTLTTEVETRKLLRELLSAGFTVQPQAQAAIEAALRAVATMAVPIRPVTDFEKVAYVDERETLTCRSDWQSAIGNRQFSFTPGRSYVLRTANYTFTESFTRQKVHFNEETGTTYPLEHTCELTGQDRYVALTDDRGHEHRFMERPKPAGEGTAAPLPARGRTAALGRFAPRTPPPAPHTEHPETLLWQIFEEPAVPTVADALPELVAGNHARLLQLAATVKE